MAHRDSGINLSSNVISNQLVLYRIPEYLLGFCLDIPDGSNGKESLGIFTGTLLTTNPSRMTDIVLFNNKRTNNNGTKAISH